jgi:hypothetical protein
VALKRFIEHPSGFLNEPKVGVIAKKIWRKPGALKKRDKK